MTIDQLIKTALPHTDKQFAEHILWGRTPYPMGKVTAQSLYKAAFRFDRATKKGKQLCDLCDHIAYIKDLCVFCHHKMNGLDLKPARTKKLMKMWNWMGTNNSGTTNMYATPLGITASTTTSASTWINQVTASTWAQGTGGLPQGTGGLPQGTGSANSLYQAQAHQIAQQLLAQAQYAGPVGVPQGLPAPPPPYDDNITVHDGRAASIKLPDGTLISVAANGSFTIEDKDAKVTYRASRVREFNSFLNASDKLESFIKFCGEVGVRQGEVLDIPIRHFIAWLVVEAARADDETAPDVPLVPDLRKITKPRCGCGRFIARKKVEKKINFCRTQCFETAMAA